MKFISKRQRPKPVADSNPWAVRRKKAKQPKFKDQDLNRMVEFDIEPRQGRYNPGWSANYSSAYIGNEDEDDTTSISSFSTNATMDDNPGTGLTIDKYFYQPVGRAIEKFALKIALKLNIYHPSPAQILRFLISSPGIKISYAHWKILYVLRNTKGVPKGNVLLYELRATSLIIL